MAVESRVVDNLLLCQGIGLQFSVQFGAIPFKTKLVSFENMLNMRGINDSFIPVKERQIEGSKIRIKVLIDELLIDAEIVGVGCALGLNACLQRDEVEPVRDVLAGAHQHIACVLHDQDLQYIDIRYELEGADTTKGYIVLDCFNSGQMNYF